MNAENESISDVSVPKPNKGELEEDKNKDHSSNDTPKEIWTW